MHAFAKKDNENLGMIVKRVSVPIGLEELMEGLTKEVLLKKPKDLYIFASEYFSRLVIMREQATDRKTYPIRSVQSITHLKSPNIVQGKKITTTRPTRHLSRQMSIRSKSPAASKNIQTDPKGNITRRSRDRIDSKEPSKPLAKRERSTSTTKKDSSRSASSVQSTPREARQNSNPRFKSKDDSNKSVAKQPKAGKVKSESKSNVAKSEVKKESEEISKGLSNAKKLAENTKKKSQDILDSDIWAASTDIKQVSKHINEENSRNSREEVKGTDKSQNMDISSSKSISIGTEMEDSGCDNGSSTYNNDAVSEKIEPNTETEAVRENIKEDEKSIQETTKKIDSDSIVGATADKVDETNKKKIGITEAKRDSANIVDECVKSITDDTIEAIEKDSTDMDQNAKENNIEEVSSKATGKANITEENIANEAEKTEKLIEDQADKSYTSASVKNNKDVGDGTKDGTNKTSLDADIAVANKEENVEETSEAGKDNKLTSSVAEIEETAGTEEDKTAVVKKNSLDAEKERMVANKDDPTCKSVNNKDDLKEPSKDDLSLNKLDEKLIDNEEGRKYSEAITDTEGKVADREQQSEDGSNKMNERAVTSEDGRKVGQEKSSEISEEKVATIEAENGKDQEAIRELEGKAIADPKMASDSIASEEKSPRPGKSTEEARNDASPEEKVENVHNIQMKSVDDSSDVLIVSISPRKTGESSNQISKDVDLQEINNLPKEETIEKTSFFRENEEVGSKKNSKLKSDQNLNIESNSEKIDPESSEDGKIEPEIDKDVASSEETKEAAKSSQNEDTKSNLDKKEIISAKVDIVSSKDNPEEPKDNASLKKVRKEIEPASIEEPSAKKSYLAKENTLAFKSVKDLLDFDNTLINKSDKENNSSEDSNELKLIIVENESMDDNIPSEGHSNNVRNKRSVTVDEIEGNVLVEDSETSKEDHKDNEAMQSSTEDIKIKTLDSEDTDISLDHDLISIDSSVKVSTNEQNNVLKIEEESTGSSKSDNNVKSVSKSQEENKTFEKDSLKNENTDPQINKAAESESATKDGRVKSEENIEIEKESSGVIKEKQEIIQENKADAQLEDKAAVNESVLVEKENRATEPGRANSNKENTFIKEEADIPEVKKPPKIGDIEQVATVIEVVKNLYNSKSTEKTNITEVRHYLNNFLQNEQSNVFQIANSQKINIESLKNDNKKKKSMLPKSKQERPLSQTNLLSNQKKDPEAKFRRTRSVGLIKTPETETRSKIPTSARKSAGRRPLVRQMEADSKELEEKLKSTSKGSGDEPSKKINGLAKDDVLIAKTILKGVEGAEKHIELIEEHLSNLENREGKYDPNKLREEIEAAAKLQKSITKGLSTINTDKEVSKDLSLDRLSDAALVIQRIWKGFQVRKVLRDNGSIFRVNGELENPNNEKQSKDGVRSQTEDLGSIEDGIKVDKKEEDAAVKIQSAWKGFVARKILRNKQNLVSREEKAIITIQAIVRGFLQRIKYEKLKTKNVVSNNEAGREINLSNDKAGVGTGAVTTDRNINNNHDKDKNLIMGNENENIAAKSNSGRQDSNGTEEKLPEYKLESNLSKETHSKEEESKMARNSIRSLPVDTDSIKSNEEDNVLESKKLSSQTVSQDLLHSSEFHATAFLPRSSKSLDIPDPEISKHSKSIRLSGTGSLKHSSEFHDIVVTPLPSSESDLNIVEVSRMILPSTSLDQIGKDSSSSGKVISQEREDQKKVSDSVDAKDGNNKLKDVVADEIEKDQMENLKSVDTREENKNLDGGDAIVTNQGRPKETDEESKFDLNQKASLVVEKSEEKPMVKANELEAKAVEANSSTAEKLEDKDDDSKEVIKVKKKIIHENEADVKLEDKDAVNESVLVQKESRVTEPDRADLSEEILKLKAVGDKNGSKIETSKGADKDDDSSHKEGKKIIQENANVKLDDQAAVDENALVRNESRVTEPERENSNEEILKLKAAGDEEIIKIKGAVDEKVENSQDYAISDKDSKDASQESKVGAEGKINNLEKSVADKNLTDILEDGKGGPEGKVEKLEEVVAGKSSKDSLKGKISGDSSVEKTEGKAESNKENLIDFLEDSKGGPEGKVEKLEEVVIGKSSKDSLNGKISGGSSLEKTEGNTESNKENLIDFLDSKGGPEGKVEKLKEVVADKSSKDSIKEKISGESSVEKAERKAESNKENMDAVTNITSFGGKEEKSEKSKDISSKVSKVGETSKDKNSIEKLEQKTTVDSVTTSISENIEDNLSAKAEANTNSTKDLIKENNKDKNSVSDNLDETEKDSKEKIAEDLQINKNGDNRMDLIIERSENNDLDEKIKETKSEDVPETTNAKSSDKVLKDLASDKAEDQNYTNPAKEKGIENDFENKDMNGKEMLDENITGTKSHDNKVTNYPETSKPNEIVDPDHKSHEKPDFYRSNTVVEPEIIKKTVTHLHESSSDLEPTQQNDKDDNNNTSKEETDLEKHVKAAVKKIVSTTPLESEVTQAVKNIVDDNTPQEKPKFDSMMSVDTALGHLPEVPSEEIPKTIVQKSLESSNQNTEALDDAKEIHSVSQNQTFDNDGSSASLEMPTDDGSMDSIVTVVLKPKQHKDAKPDEVKKSAKKLANKALSTSAIEDHVVLLDQVQNSLLDQLSGKPVDTNSKFDIDHLRKELHDASTMYTSEDHEDDNDHEVMDYLYDFEPEDESYDSRMVRTPLRELPDIAEETESKEEDGFCGSSNVNPTNEHAEIIRPPKSHEIIIDNGNIKINKSDQKLLHSSELHDSVLVPTPYEFLHQPQIEDGNLKHTSEFHDTVVLPLPSGSDVTITNASKKLLPSDGSNKEEHGNESSSQVPPGTTKTVTPQSSRRRSTQNGVVDDDVAGAHASLTDTSSSKPTEPGGSSLLANQSPPPLFSTRSDKQNMESEQNNNNKRNNAILPGAEKNMEAQAATKIQAGFRGYQVRKQLKAKNAATDQKRLLRKRSSRENMKETDLEEKSAVKIQAGVRGFLVRRRQKKQVSGSASA